MVPDISSKNKRDENTRRYVRSSSFIMALLFTVLCGATAIILGLFINYFAKGHLVHSAEAVLDSEIRYLQDIGKPVQYGEYEDRLVISLSEGGKLPAEYSSHVFVLSEGIIVLDSAKDNRKYAAKIHTYDSGKQVLVGFDITEIAQDFKLMQWLGVASICFIIVVVFISYVISIFVVQGTNSIAETAREIMETGDLSRRVEISGRWDDLSNMTATLNMLLARMEELMHGVRQVSDNIAHDLRTPLTRMRNHIEELQKSGNAHEYSALIEEADQLLNTFNALLRISRLESEKQKSQFCTVALHEIIEDVIEFYAPLAEEKSITLNCNISPATISGDKDLLFQAFANLLDNAVKFTPQNGEVSVTVLRQNGQIYVTIHDSGSGVSDEETSKIFERFYRAEKSRTTAGTGLGLSMVSAVIALHDANIRVENTHPGLKIITIF